MKLQMLGVVWLSMRDHKSMTSKICVKRPAESRFMQFNQYLAKRKIIICIEVIKNFVLRAFDVDLKDVDFSICVSEQPHYRSQLIHLCALHGTSSKYKRRVDVVRPCYSPRQELDVRRRGAASLVYGGIKRKDLAFGHSRMDSLLERVVSIRSQAVYKTRPVAVPCILAHLLYVANILATIAYAAKPLDQAWPFRLEALRVPRPDARI
mmetsp:Transcript_6187/g.16494  ORF Transcript_6187/g.16494 Transcript_6187/m.16494 type:complete len:208 (+) Transcript_6187:123-746(+)